MNANLYARFAERWNAAAQTPALIDEAGEGPDFAALDDLSARMAAVLAGRGVATGDRVVVQVEKSIGAVALYLACLRMGAIFVPLNPAYTASEVAYFLTDADAALFVSATGENAEAIAGALLSTSENDGLWAEACLAKPYNAIYAARPDECATILYTSGTTGRSKGAMISHGNLASNAEALMQIWGITDADVLIHALPVFHVHGLFIALNTMFLAGATTLFLPRFDVTQIRRVMARGSVLMGVPTFYTRLLAEPGFGRDEAEGIRLFISGSAPLLAETHNAFEAGTGQRILERYGMTETGVITSNPLNGARIAGTVGHALPGVEVRTSEGGMIEVRGPNVFKGYWRNPEKTAQDIRSDGWFITGDVGTLDAEGRLTIAGREKDLIISGGFNITPGEIEAVIDAVPGVIESAVIGAPHPDFGESVVAVIVGNADQSLIEAEVAARLARFKHPRHYAFLPELPRNAMGKVQKAVLRERFGDVFGG